MTLLLTAMFLTFSACSSDDDEIKQETKDTTYTFTYTADNPPQGITANITLFEYNDKGERVSQNAVNNVRKGHSQSECKRSEGKSVSSRNQWLSIRSKLGTASLLS